MSWIIKGEAGKTLDATARSFADLNISGCLLKFQSLAYDQLTWQAGTLNASGAGTIVPDYGQIVELWWNSTRKFRIFREKTKARMNGISTSNFRS